MPEVIEEIEFKPTQPLDDPGAVDATFDEDEERVSIERDVEDIEKHIVGEILTRFEKSKKSMEPVHRRWEENLRLDGGDTLRTVYNQNLSDVSVQLVRRSVTTWIKSMREGLFSDDMFVDVETIDLQDNQQAEAMGHLIRWQLKQQKFVSEMLERGFPSLLVLGNLVTKTCWERREGERTVSRNIEIPIPDPVTGSPTGFSLETTLSETMTEVLINQPKTRTVDLFSLYPSTLGVDTMQDLEWLIETSVVSWHDVWEGRERPGKVEDITGQTVVRRLGRYKNWERLDPMNVQSHAAHGAGTGVNEDQASQTDNSKDDLAVDGFLRKEMWWKVDLGRVLGVRGDGGARKFSLRSVMAFLEKFDLSPKALEPGGWYVFEIMDDKVLVRCRKNPFPHDKLPYNNMQYLKRIGHLWGDGLYDLAGGLQMCLDSITSSTIDLQKMIVNPMVIYDRSALDDQFGDAEEQFEYEPFKGIAITGSSVVSVRDLFDFFRPPENLMQQGVFATKEISGLIREITGATSELFGIQSQGRKTAFEVNSKESQALQFILMVNERFENLIMEPIGDMMYMLNQTHLTQPQVVTIMGDSGQRVPLQIQPEWLQGRMNVIARGTQELVNRMTLSQVLTNQLVQFMQIDPTVVNIREWIKQIIKVAKIQGDTSKLLNSPEQQQAMMRQIAAAQQGAQGGQGQQQLPGPAIGPDQQQAPIMGGDQQMQQMMGFGGI